MIAGFEGDSGSVEEGVDKGEIVGAHLREALRIFIDEGSLEDGVDCANRVTVIDFDTGDRGSAGVVGPFALVSVITDREEEDFDSVRESNIKAGGCVLTRDEGLTGGCLDLFDEDIAGSAGHAFSFIVGNNGVICPDLAVAECGGGCYINGDVGDNSTVHINSGDIGVFEDQKLTPVSE